MFFTEPQFSLPVPKGLGLPNSEYWRAFHLIGMLSFFVATFRVGKGVEAMHQTLCISSERDLIQRIRQVPDEPIVGLLCLCPPWMSKDKQWSTRHVSSVWQGVDKVTRAKEVILVTNDGEEFVPSISNIKASKVVDRELVAQLGV